MGDMESRLEALSEKVTDLHVAQGRLEERVSSLEEWQAKQNGALQRLEAKVDNINKTLIGLMGGVITSLILLVINLALRR